MGREHPSVTTNRDSRDKPTYIRVVLTVQLPNGDYGPMQFVEVQDPAHLLEWDAFPLQMEMTNLKPEWTQDVPTGP